MHLRELFLKEDDRSTAVFAFGRFNPPTIGHEKLINKVQQVADKVNGKAYIFLSHTDGTAKDPIDFTTKLSYLRQHFQSDPKLSFGDIRANTIIKVMKVLEQEGRTKVIMVAGDDRVMQFKNLLNQYNGKPTKAGNIEYTFDSIDVVSAGQRDPDADDVTGVSASKARELAMKGQEHEFSKIIMGGDKGKVLYDKIQDQFGKTVDENNKKLYNEDMTDTKPIVYLDMDGVLADFFGGVEKLYGVSHWKELTADKTKDLKKEVIDRITGTDFFATLPKFPTADALIDMVKTFTGGTFSINTSPLRGDHENSGKYKKVWHIQNVPKRSGILIHKGNFIRDTHGCPLVGLSHSWAGNAYSVRSSNTAINKMREELGQNDFILKIAHSI